MSIRVLSSQVVSRIAAGEVVERPSSIVKELVENSLDAGASRVSVEVSQGGTSMIRVTDNGSGIPTKELELAFRRHATSKIVSIEDLNTNLSLGFRGEALPSIAAAADVELASCAAGEVTGSFIRLHDGSVVDIGSRGHDQGTTVTVENLFQQVPARLKFLKSAATENKHIANIVSQYALAFPEVRFQLRIDGRNTFSTTGSGRLIDSVAHVYGFELAQNMLEIETGYEHPEMEVPVVVGMVGLPKVSRTSRDYLSLFVNRRWIKNRSLSWAIEKAYHGLLMTGKHPVAIINISLPGDEVDINVHPAKTDIKFHSERSVFSAVQKVVRQTLIKQVPIPNIEEIRSVYRKSATPVQMRWPAENSRDSSTPPLEETPSTPISLLPALRLLGQLYASYIIAEGPNGLYLIDQHAAHERILFEQIREQRSRNGIEIQTLLEPIALEFSPRQKEIMENRLEDLAGFGFSIDRFGKDTYLVRTIPAILASRDWPRVLGELLDSERDNDNWDERVAISIACRSAIKAGQVLTHDEMREMLRQLESTKIPKSCPHGRPTMIHLDLERLGKEFRRR